MEATGEQKQTQEPSDDNGQHFSIKGDNLYRQEGIHKILISNFHLRIKSQEVLQDEDMPGARRYEMIFKSKAKEFTFLINSDDFLSRRLLSTIAETAGSSAILWGTLRELQIATQQLSGEVAEKIVRSRGLTPDGVYLSEGMIISPSGIRMENTGVLPGSGNYYKNLGFLYPDQSKLIELGNHIYSDFLELKPHHISYPVTGHTILALFASAIRKRWGMDKPAMHIQGVSGSGKSFIASRCVDFYGDFGGRLPPWKSTANAIETLGFESRDSIFCLDDYKQNIIPQAIVARVLHGHAGEQGRDRLSPALHLLKTPYVRGLLLSTGEDFITDMESVSARVIRLEVGPEKNLEAGRRCLAWSKQYRMFLPSLIQMVIAEPQWQDRAREFIDTMVDSYMKEAEALPNGLRIAENWGLNALGFTYFLRFLEHLRVIEKEKKEKVWNEYNGIVRDHLQEQKMVLQLENPVEIFFRVITEKIALGSICITGWNEEDEKDLGKTIGMVKGKKVMLFPDAVLEVLARHYHAIGTRLPFSKNSLRDALAREGLISQSREGRWAIQFRGDGGIRHQGWSFDLKTLRTRVTI